MSHGDSATPQALLDLYRALTPEQQTEFIRLVARESNTHLFGAFFNALPLPERAPFMQQALEHVARVQRPILIQHTLEVVRRFPTLSVDEMVGEVSADYERALVELEEGISALVQHTFKDRRDRKSDPEIVRRNVEICDLRRQDRKKWTLGRLARKYGVTNRAITKVIQEESKWRRLAARPGTN